MSKSKSTEWLESLTEQFLPDEEAFSSSPLKSAAASRADLKRELVNIFSMGELNKELSVGTEYMRRYISTRLSAKEQAECHEGINAFLKNFSEHKPVVEGARDWADLCGMSPFCLQVMENVGESAFTEEDYVASSGVFALLCMLKPFEPKHWLRRGLSCQATRHYEDAEAAFDKATILTEDNPGPILLHANCLLERGNKEKAKYLIKEAEKLMAKSSEYQKNWGDYYQELQRLI